MALQTVRDIFRNSLLVTAAIRSYFPIFLRRFLVRTGEQRDCMGGYRQGSVLTLGYLQVIVSLPPQQHFWQACTLIRRYRYTGVCMASAGLRSMDNTFYKKGFRCMAANCLGHPSSTSRTCLGCLGVILHGRCESHTPRHWCSATPFCLYSHLYKHMCTFPTLNLFSWLTPVLL
jgi:hypothetical protein